MTYSHFQLVLLVLITIQFTHSRIRTLKNFRSLKNSNMNRLRQTRQLGDSSFSGGSLLFGAQNMDDGNNHNDSYMMLSYEIAKREADIKSLGTLVDSIQNKVDDLSESVVERINEVYNLVNTQLLGADGI